MSYPPIKDRIRIEKPLVKLEKKIANLNHFSAGDLSYVIMRLCICYIQKERTSFHNINDVFGVLSIVTLELKDRILKGFLIQKRSLNGDIGNIE